MKKIRIAVKNPGEDWEIRTAEDALPTYQKIVGGYIEHFEDTASGVHLFCNEDGKLKRLKPNLFSLSLRETIMGPVFAVRSDDEGNFVGLTDEDVSFFTGE